MSTSDTKRTLIANAAFVRADIDPFNQTPYQLVIIALIGLARAISPFMVAISQCRRLGGTEVCAAISSGKGDVALLD